MISVNNVTPIIKTLNINRESQEQYAPEDIQSRSRIGIEHWAKILHSHASNIRVTTSPEGMLGNQKLGVPHFRRPLDLASGDGHTQKRTASERLGGDMHMNR